MEKPKSTKGILLSLGALLSAGGFSFIADSISNFPIDVWKMVAGLVLIMGAFISFYVRENYKDTLGE